MSKLISVIVSTYNRPDALGAVLRSLARQTDRSFEIVVADDGSGPATRSMIEDWTARLDVPLRHVWQDDRGYRLAEIRNRAIRTAAGDYLVFIDGDCIVRPDFVAAHRALAEPGHFVGGNRVFLSQRLTGQVLAQALEPEVWSLAFLVRLRLAGDVNRLAPLLRLPGQRWRKRLPNEWEGVRGGNIAFFRDDLMRIDGFESDFVGWGLEDSDAVIRAIRAGVRRKDGRFATGVLHLWHPEADRSQLAANRARLDDVLRSDRVRARRGLSALDGAPPARKSA